jgi:hypothetical protein
MTATDDATGTRDDIEREPAASRVVEPPRDHPAQARAGVLRHGKSFVLQTISGGW